MEEIASHEVGNYDLNKNILIFIYTKHGSSRPSFDNITTNGR